MDPTEAADAIAESAEQHHHSNDAFRNRAALVIAILAALLAVCGLGGDNSKDAMIYNNIKASDSWAFYQAKNQRQTAYKLAADQLTRETESPGIALEVRAAALRDLGKYKETVARYEDEPDRAAPQDPTRGEGKKQLKARAEAFEQSRETASQQNDDFDFAQMTLQLAIVLGSVSILATSRPLLWVSGALGALGATLLANGFWFKLPLPF